MQNKFMMSIDYSSSVIWIPPKKFHMPVGQVKNRILQPNSKVHQGQAIEQYFPCIL